MLFGAQPNLADTMIEEFISINKQTDSDLSLTEQLYSKRGLQSMATGHSIVESNNYDFTDFNQYMLINVKPFSFTKPNKYYKKRVIWSSNTIPGFDMKDRNSR